MNRNVLGTILIICCIVYVMVNCRPILSASIVDTPEVLKQKYEQHMPVKTIVVAEYEIGAYKPDPRKYGTETYDNNKTQLFLETIKNKFKDGDIVAVDTLKYKKATIDGEGGYWEPYPNPPEPILEKGEDAGKHIKEYAYWINTHPHMGYPPLPVSFDE